MKFPTIYGRVKTVLGKGGVFVRLKESGEMYLETIYVLLKKQGSVRAIDVGEHMGYSKPSVSRAMGLLKEAALICVSGDGTITLTAEGLAVAEKIYRRHIMLSEFLQSIGIPDDIASEDACKIEHYISDTTYDAIKAHMDKIKKL